ncbi:LOW QUALITY PROTEIN: toll-like receptor 12 [Gastrophryne carolinensis]
MVQNNYFCNFLHFELFKAKGSDIDMEDILFSGIKAIKSMLLSINEYDKFQICCPTSQFQAEEMQLILKNILRMSTGSCEHLKTLDLSNIPSATSTCWLCNSLLHHNCQVLEKNDYAPFIDLKFDNCRGFEDLDFSIAVTCDSVKDLHRALKEVPIETDWLCFTNYSGVIIEAEVFSQFSNLKSLYISGDVDLLPGAFSGPMQLSTLWIESWTHNTTLCEGTFRGLSSIQELKIFSLPFSTFNLSILSHLHLLDHLILEDNNITHLSEVTTSLGIFQNLKKLSIISNNIKELRYEDCFTKRYEESIGFIDFNISYLDLSGNALFIIQNNSLCNFPHLEVFKAEVRGMPKPPNILMSGIKTIKIFYFIVKIFQLSHESFGLFTVCWHTSQFQIEEIQVSFSSNLYISIVPGSCKHLKKLNISANKLEPMLGGFQMLSNLLELDLSNNHIEELEICYNKSGPTMQLIYFNVSHNYITSLQNKQFICLKHLRILALQNNRIRDIAESAFHHLNQLQVLNLQYNNLLVIDKLTFTNLFVLRQINLYGNRIQDFHSTALQHLYDLEYIGLTFHEMLDLFPLIFMPRSVKHISVKATFLQLLDNIGESFPILKSLEMDSPNIIITCSKFSHAKELHLKNIVSFRCESTEESPFLNFTSVEKLYYTGQQEDFSDSTLSNALKYLPSLKFLSLQDTEKMVKYGHLNVHDMFQGLSHLKVLHLKNSGIEHWDSKDITRDFHELEFLFIENQSIEKLKVSIFDSMPKLEHIYFLQTMFPCSCEFSELLSWLESGTRVSIINFHQQKCQINKNSTNLISFLQSNCQTKWDLIMFLVTFHFTLMFLCASLFFESIWWYFLYIVYTVKCWINHRQQDKGQYDYDAFVSYNTHDEPWVLHKFLPYLELNGPPFFKLCIHNRDFEIGKYIVDNIMDSIYNSRWTVCIISRKYLHSNWCSLEMRMATYRLLAESKDSLILIFIDKISREELQHYHRLTKLMDKKTYLDWPEDENGQQLFWARLRKVIAKSGRKL